MVAEGRSPSSRPQATPGAGGEPSSRDVDSVGAYLQRLRAAKGAALGDIARATRVGRCHLEALEGNESGELPAPVFVKGFIRAYCEFLETKPDEALARYRPHRGPVATPPRFAGGRGGRGAPSRLGSPITVSLLLLAVLSGALIAVNLGLRSGRSSVATPSAGPQPEASAARAVGAQPVPASTVQSAAPAPAGTPAKPDVPAAPAAPSAASPAALPPAAAGSGPMPASPALANPGPPSVAAPRHRLLARAVEDTWVKVQIDRTTVLSETLRAGTSREWTAEQGFVLTVGNAGGLDLTLNGQRLPPLGVRGAVIHEMVLPQHAAAPRS